MEEKPEAREAVDLSSLEIAVLKGGDTDAERPVNDTRPLTIPDNKLAATSIINQTSLK